MEGLDRAYLRSCRPALDRRVAESTAEIAAFAAAGPCYVGTSWGKDSIVVAHLATALDLPLVCVWCQPIQNPDCAAVRDAYLGAFPATRYDEIEVWCRRSETDWHATGTMEEGFAIAAGRHGGRYISGIRAEESSTRALRVRSYGLSTARACAPIGWWSAAEIFAYLALHDLPIHPAYACSLAGTIDRGRLRVSSLGGRRGMGRGRAEWERRYYGAEMRALSRM